MIEFIHDFIITDIEKLVNYKYNRKSNYGKI